VTGKRQFLARGENAQLVAGAGVGWQQEDGLGQVQPAGNGLHRGRIQALAVHHHAQGVALAGAFAEDIQLQIAALHAAGSSQNKAGSLTCTHWVGQWRRHWHRIVITA
jgi:hypothetical protein